MIRAIISVDYYSNTLQEGTAFVLTECSMVISIGADGLLDAVNAAVARRARSLHKNDVGMYGRVLCVTIIPSGHDEN